MEEKRNVLMLPRGPFVESDGGHFAYRMEDGVAVRTPVSLGVSSLTAIEVLSGVRAGDRVVVSGTDVFANAPRVSVNP